MLKCFSRACFLWASFHRPENNKVTRERIGQYIIRDEKHSEGKEVGEKQGRRVRERQASWFVCVAGQD